MRSCQCRQCHFDFSGTHEKIYARREDSQSTAYSANSQAAAVVVYASTARGLCAWKLEALKLVENRSYRLLNCYELDLQPTS